MSQKGSQEVPQDNLVTYRGNVAAFMQYEREKQLLVEKRIKEEEAPAEFSTSDGNDSRMVASGIRASESSTVNRDNSGSIAGHHSTSNNSSSSSNSSFSISNRNYSRYQSAVDSGTIAGSTDNFVIARPCLSEGCRKGAQVRLLADEYTRFTSISTLYLLSLIFS